MAAIEGRESIEREMEEARQRLAGTIDELLYRSSPKTIVSRQIAQVKAFFVDPDTGETQTDNLVKVAVGVVGVSVLFLVVRRVVGSADS